MMAWSVSKRRSNHCLTRRGVTLPTHCMAERLHLTSRRAMRDEPNISSPLWALPRPISVLVTLRAFGEVASDTTITTPAPTRNHTGVLAEPLSDPMR